MAHSVNVEVTLLDGTPVFKCNYAGYIPRAGEYIQYKGIELQVADVNWIHEDNGKLDFVQILVKGNYPS